MAELVTVRVKVSARQVYGVRVKTRWGMCICLRTTTTRIRRDANEKHDEQDPAKLRRQVNLRVSMSACVHLCKRLRAYGLLTLVRSCHFEAMPYSPETSRARLYDGDVNG